MTTFGNLYWNTATDNKNKSIISCTGAVFDTFSEKLNVSGINYYGYEQDNTVRIAVDDKDINWLRKIAGSGEISIQKSQKQYTPPEKNIIGNTAYKYIPDKTYFSTDRDTLLKMAELMNSENIKFSGRVYENGKGTLTVSGTDADAVKRIRSEVISMRKQFVRSDVSGEKDNEIIGNTRYSDIKNKHFFISALKPEDYYNSRDFLENQSIRYSGIIRDHKVMFSVDESDSAAFYRLLSVAHNRQIIIDDLMEAGDFTQAQIAVLDSLIETAAEQKSYTDISSFVSADYTDEQLKALSERLELYMRQPENDKWLDKNGIFAEITEMKSKFDQLIALEAVTADKNYSEDQKEALLMAVNNGLDPVTLDQLDNTFTPEDINKYVQLFLKYDAAGMYAFVEEHRSAMNAEINEDISNSIFGIHSDVSEPDNSKEIFIKALEERRTVSLYFPPDRTEDRSWYPVADAKKTDLKNHRIEYDESLGYVWRAENDRMPNMVLRSYGKDDIERVYDDIINKGYITGEISDPVVPEPVRRFSSAGELLENISEVSAGLPSLNNFSSGDVFLIREGAVSADPLDAVISLELSLNERVSPEKALEIINDISSVKVNAVYADVMFADNTGSGVRQGHARTVKLVPEDFSRLLESTRAAAAKKDYSYRRLIADAGHVREYEKAAKETLNEYLGKAELMPCIISKMLAGDELDNIAERYNDGTDHIKLAKENISSSGVIITVPGTERPEEHSYFPIGVSAEVGTAETFTGMRFYSEDFSAEYTWKEISDFLEKAVNDHEAYENEWERIYSAEREKAAPEKEEQIRKIFADISEKYSFPEEAEKYLNVLENVTVLHDLESVSADMLRGYPYVNRFGSAEYIDARMDGKLGEVINSVNKSISMLSVEISSEKEKENDPADHIYDTPVFEAAYSEEYEENEKTETAEADPFEQMSMFVEKNDVPENQDEKQSVTADNEKVVNNFRIEDSKLGEGGPKSKFRNNMEAIRILKLTEAENRPATAEEKEILSKYVGWGGISMAFDKDNSSWSKEYSELKELLTDNEYRCASASTLDSFYTSPVLIEKIYEALRRFGYEGGNLLEPSCGVGNFIGCMPEDMARNTKTYGVELDSLSGRIAQKLYPEADIQIKGFEKTSFPDGCFDAAVGNVPFGDYNLKYRDHSLKIHDFFFVQALDKIKNGGIAAFITSTGTLDKKSESFRKELAEKADLIGAVRLPSGAFKANAGTDVTSDIIFLQKRTAPPVEMPGWVHISENENGLPVNSYFADNPEMILGTLTEDTNPFGSRTKVIPHKDSDLGAELSEALKKLNAVISDEHTADVYPLKENGSPDVSENIRNYSFFVKGEDIYFKASDDVCGLKYGKNDSGYDRALAFIGVRDTTRELLAAQEQNQSDEIIKSLQDKLNSQYDSFYKKYGLLHNRTNKKFFREDISYNLTLSLEKSFENDKLTEKSDIFTRRTIMPAEVITHVETAMEALAISSAEKACVDFEYMGQLTGLDKPSLLAELKGEIYQIPGEIGVYQTANEYLSGDIYSKLRTAEAAAEEFSNFKENVEALRAVIPEPLKAGDIEIKIGAAWIDTKLYDQFMYETFETPRQFRNDVKHSMWERSSVRIDTEYCSETGVFQVNNRREDKSVAATKTFGTKYLTAYEIMENLLNLKESRITKKIKDPVTGEEKRVTDIEATKVAQRKADKIRGAFRDWIFKDPERREELVKKYNELFNSIRPRQYDGKNLKFPNMNADIRLHEHQKNAVAHALFGGNTLFAHSVGAGKTFEMITAAMESKRLGFCTKSLFVVPNHLTEQIAADFQKLYPSANILTATKNDFKKENRQQLFAKIATGNYDAVIIGHSQLKMIPLSYERQKDVLEKQISDIVSGIETLKKNQGSEFMIKQLEKEKKRIEGLLTDLQVRKQDKTVTFEEMGIDKMFVDEVHEFKNLFTITKLQNVSGISTTSSQKAFDLFSKCQYLDEKTGGKGVVFATGTPVSNSVTELHTMMRYLEYDFLKQKGLSNFDNWVAVFGQQKTDWELAPAGNKFKQRTRIANYTGLPELMSMFKQIADVRTADTLKLDVPECETHIINAEATEFQKILVRELADRADDVQEGKIEPSVDNMLRITSDGRKLGLDPRLIDPSFEDDPSTKLNQCVRNVFDIYQETSDRKLTQIIFCDLGVPHKSSAENEKENDESSAAERESFEEECEFCVYDDIKNKLVSKGVSSDEIAYIHDAKTEKQKTELFEKVRTGEVRILIGSTSKMGTGTNVQDKLIALHDLDIPWRPADMEQRSGRMIRQGNQNPKVHLYRYVTKGTFDSYSYQTLECKQKFISQIMTSKTPVRKCEDVDQQALSYGEIKALCTGDERIKEKMQLDNEVKELRILKAEYTNTLYDMQARLRSSPAQEEKLINSITAMTADMKKIQELPVDPETKLPVFSININSKEFTDKTEAAKALNDTTLGRLLGNENRSIPIGSFQGFELSVYRDSFSKSIHATLKGEAEYTVEFGSSYSYNLKRLEGTLYRIDSLINNAENQLNQLRVDTAEAQKIVDTPFAHEKELEMKSERLDVLTDELNQAAAEAKQKNPAKERTVYFDRAKLKREAVKAKKTENRRDKDKDKGRGGDDKQK